ncbi:MAG: hypothetical protein Q7S96_02135 [bacterium]|nr:hypothetical protein [bacterium]
MCRFVLVLAMMASGCAATQKPVNESTMMPWSGHLIVDFESEVPRVILLYTFEDITPLVMERGLAVTAQRVDSDLYRYGVQRSRIFKDVFVTKGGRVYGSVVVDDSTVYIRASPLLEGKEYRCRARSSVCGPVYKLDVEDIIGCEGPRCDELIIEHNSSDQPLHML